MYATERIEQAIEPSVTAMGFEIVRVQLSGGRRPVLQIMVERSDRAPVSLDDCAGISRTVSAVLDVHEPIEGSYTLEVSSPGIDRPLTRMGDYERFAGFEARLETWTAIEGRRRFRGVLRGVTEGKIQIELPEGSALVPYDQIQRARLVLTDALIAAST